MSGDTDEPGWGATVEWDALERAGRNTAARAKEAGLLPTFKLSASSRAIITAIAAFAEPLTGPEWTWLANQLLVREGLRGRLHWKDVEFLFSNGVISKFAGATEDGCWVCLLEDGYFRGSSHAPGPLQRRELWREQVAHLTISHDISAKEARLIWRVLHVDGGYEQGWPLLGKYLRRHPGEAASLTYGLGKRGEELRRVNVQAGESLSDREAFSAGRAARTAGDWGLAEALFMRAIELDPKRSHRVGLAALWREWGHLDEAERLYDQLLAEEREAAILVGFSRLKRERGELKAAESLCREALTIRRDPVALTALGAILREANRAPEALGAFEEALQHAVGSKRCHPLAGLAAAEIAVGHYDAGEAAWASYAAQGCPPAPDTGSLEKLRRIYIERGDSVGASRVAALLGRIRRQFR